jgi:predicted transcriptional regulator
MVKTTIRIRLDSELSQELEQASRHLHRGINWIIDQALKCYLANIHQETLIHEARRQSLLASHQFEGDDLWQSNADLDDWNSSNEKR